MAKEQKLEGPYDVPEDRILVIARHPEGHFFVYVRGCCLMMSDINFIRNGEELAEDELWAFGPGVALDGALEWQDYDEDFQSRHVIAECFAGIFMFSIAAVKGTEYGDKLEAYKRTHGR